MLPEFASAAYAARWRQALDRGLEAGQSPALHFDGVTSFIDAAQGMAALQLLAAQSDGLTGPAAIAGGSGALWPALLLQVHPTATRAAASSLRPVYGGVDPASILAARALYADGDRPLQRSAYLRPPADLPAALVAPIAPRAEPTPAVTWAMLPAWEIDRAQSDAQERSGGETWLAYLTIMLAVLLILAALVVSITP